MQIVEARLTTRRLEEQKAFYGRILSLPLVEDDGRVVAFGVGTSRLVFVRAESGGEPLYHFAFDVPRNKFVEAKAWLAGRVDLLDRDGRDEFEFSSWNATAVYFRDPAGNVVELIARRNLPNDSGRPFGSDGLLRVSEVGVVSKTCLRPCEAWNVTSDSRSSPPSATRRGSWSWSRPEGRGSRPGSPPGRIP
jgi:catechol 2,3-dioxygenase-like lactoylglutathione lyase family enzyme